MESKAYLISLSTSLKALENEHKGKFVYDADPEDLSWTEAFTLKQYWELDQEDKVRIREFME